MIDANNDLHLENRSSENESVKNNLKKYIHKTVQMQAKTTDEISHHRFSEVARENRGGDVGMKALISEKWRQTLTENRFLVTFHSRIFESTK